MLSNMEICQSTSKTTTSLALQTYELLLKVQNVLNTDNLVPQFLYFARSVEEMRKKWQQAEERCKELENKMTLEKSNYQRKIKELIINIENYQEEKNQAEKKSEKLQMELDRMQQQFEMFKEILGHDKHSDLLANYGGNYGPYIPNSEIKKPVFSGATEMAAAVAAASTSSQNIEDTNQLISDYTEDDIDMELNEDRGHESDEVDFDDDNDENLAPVVPKTPQNKFLIEPSPSALIPPKPPSTSSLPPPSSSSNVAAVKQQLQPTLSTVAMDSPARRRRGVHHRQHRHEQPPPLPQHQQQRRPSSLNRPTQAQSNQMLNDPASTSSSDDGGEAARHKRRTRSIDRVINTSGGGGITAITTLQIGQNGRPITVTSEIQHQLNSSTTSPATAATTVPTAHDLVQQEKVTTTQKNGALKWPMTPMTPHGLRQNTVTTSLMPLAKKYKKAHHFKTQMILNGEQCAHCDKRPRFGKAVFKCTECEMVVHAECRDLLQRPCYPVLSFPAQGSIGDYVPSVGEDGEPQRPQVPPILQMIINEIEAKGLLSHEIGLYRVNGSDVQIKQIKDRLVKRHQAPDLRKINDVNVLCGFVKDFLNNLSEHLVPYDSWYRFARAAGLANESDRIVELQHAIQDLPTPNRDTLSFMMLHLQRIAETSECKMPASNLARVLGPSLVGNSSPNLPAADIINEIQTQHQIVEALIRVPAQFYLQFVETGEQQQQRLFKQAASAIRTPDTASRTKTAVVLSSILGPAANLPNK